MMSKLSLVFAPLVATGFGWFLLRLFKTRLPFLEKLALAYTFGLAAITLLMFYFNVIGIPFSLGGALIVPLTTILYLGLKNRNEIKFILRNPKKKVAAWKKSIFASWRELSFWEKITFLIIVFLLLTALARALYWPVFYWDAICAYDARAKFFIRDGLITKVAQKVSWQFNNYPPFTSLAHTYFYLLGASNPKILYVLICVSLLVTMYYSLRQHASRLVSFALTLLLAANPFIIEHAAASYTNLSYTFFLGMGTIYLVRFFEKKEIFLFWVGTLLFALGSWVRPSSEWFFLSALLVLTTFVVLEKRFYWILVAFIFTFVAIWLPWPLFLKFVIGQEDLRVAAGSKTFSIINNLISGTLQGKVEFRTFLGMMKLLWETIKGSLNYILYLFLIAFLIGLFKRRVLRKNIYLLLFIGIYAGTVLLGVYNSLFAWADWQNLVTNAVNRFIMIFLPLLVYYIGMVFADTQKK